MIYLFGASGHAKVIYEALRKNHKQINGIVDDNKGLTHFLNLKVAHSLPDAEGIDWVICVGNNTIRKHISRRLKDESFINVLHPNAYLGKIQMGKGNVVMAGASINIDAEIGDHCIINTNSSVDHDCIIGDFVHIAPGTTLCGGVQIGNESLIGAGSTIIPNIKVGSKVTVGAGTTIIHDIPDGCTVVGNPGKIVKYAR
jgi:acetyltransferase EpsM